MYGTSRETRREDPTIGRVASIARDIALQVKTINIVMYFGAGSQRVPLVRCIGNKKAQIA